jgi:hypothetical protein
LQAIITLVHGTWASKAVWTRPDSDLYHSLRQTAERIGVQVDVRTRTWSGSNSVRGREEAARTLIERLREDFKLSPAASHFLIAHSHGGNIVIDAVRADGVGERVSGIVTMSTPFVSCRRSGVRVTGALLAVLGTLALLAFTAWGFGLYFQALSWVWNQAESHISSGLVLWPVRLLLFFLGLVWTAQLAKIIGEGVVEGFAKAWEAITGWQDSVLERFDRHLGQPIPMFCVRFRMDEVLMALTVSRLFVKPVRVLTIVASWMVAIGVLLLVTFWPIGFFGLTTDVDLVYRNFAELLLFLGVVPTIVFMIIWTFLGYVMGSMTLGHWGGIIDQLLVDFRITGIPEGASAVSKVYSPWRRRRTLLHSLTYGDRNALADISHWVGVRMLLHSYGDPNGDPDALADISHWVDVRMRDDGKTRSAAGGSGRSPPVPG